MHKSRILQVLPTLDSRYGGPVRVVESIAKGLESTVFEVETYPRPGFDLRHLPGPAYWPGYKQLLDLAKLIEVSELVHIHGLWTIPTSYAAYIARKHGRPYIITPHGMLDRWSMRRSQLKKLSYRLLVEQESLNCSAAVHFLNAEEWNEGKEFIEKTKVFVLGNGVDVSSLSKLPSRNASRTSQPQLGESLIILFLGRLHEKKGLELLLRSFKSLAQPREDISLVVAGTDTNGYGKRMRHLAQKLGIEERVMFTGEVLGDQKKMWLGAADVFVLPSYQEGDSVAVKEALAAGIPVIISRACHLPEVEEFEAGIVCDNTEESLRNSLGRLLGNSALREQMSDNARLLAASRYDVKEVVGKLGDIYIDILSGTKNSKCWSREEAHQQEVTL